MKYISSTILDLDSDPKFCLFLTCEIWLFVIFHYWISASDIIPCSHWFLDQGCSKFWGSFFAQLWGDLRFLGVFKLRGRLRSSLHGCITAKSCSHFSRKRSAYILWSAQKSACDGEHLLSLCDFHLYVNNARHPTFYDSAHLMWRHLDLAEVRLVTTSV